MRIIIVGKQDENPSTVEHIIQQALEASGIATTVFDRTDNADTVPRVQSIIDNEEPDSRKLIQTIIDNNHSIVIETVLIRHTD